MNGQDVFAENPDSKLKIKVIKSTCIRAGVCVIQAPQTFDLDDDGIAYVKEGTWDEAVAILQAAKACPTLAIIIEDLNGNQLWPKETA
jgi:ferredoxin